MSTVYRVLLCSQHSAPIPPWHQALIDAGHHVVRVGRHEQAVAEAAASPWDVILLQTAPEPQSALETCSALKSHPDISPIPFILMDQRRDPALMIQAFSKGAADYVAEPVGVDELLARISVHAGARRTESQLVEKNRQTAALAKRLTELNAELAQLSRTDPLTQLLNRRAWQESAALEHERSVRYGHCYGLIMIDVDHFKAFNDRLGHQAGDEALQQVASCVLSACRKIDLAARYGGEEFVVLAPEMELPEVRALAERIRRAVWNLEIQHPDSPCGGRLTISAGSAVSHQHATLAATLNAADQALYHAKGNGRNRVSVSRLDQGAWGISDEALPGDGHDSRPPHGAPAKPPLVLLATSDQHLSGSWEAILTHMGFACLTVAHAQSIPARTRSNKPAVILLDTDLGRLDWKACVRQLRSRPATANIPIALIGRGDASQIAASMEMGIEDYLVRSTDDPTRALRLRTLVRLGQHRHRAQPRHGPGGEATWRLESLLDYCRQLVTQTDLTAVLDRTLNAASALTGFKKVAILLPDEQSRLHVARSLGDTLPRDARQPLEEGLAGSVFRNRQSVICQDEHAASNHLTTVDRGLFCGPPLACQILDTPGEAVGVMCLSDRSMPDPLEARQLESLEVIAQVGAASIHDLLTREAHQRACDSIVVALAKLAEFRDNDTGRHLERVARYCAILADHLRAVEPFDAVIDDEFISDLERAVPLHDIGKVAVPDSILLKAGKLTDDEMATMRTHAAIGAETIRIVRRNVPQATFLVMAEQIARSHHERFDGRGYPDGLKGEAIPPAARITALADVYDALTTKRSYKNAMTHDEAVQVIAASAGTQFDPTVVKAFLDREKEFAACAASLADDTLPYRPESSDHLSDLDTPILESSAVLLPIA